MLRVTTLHASSAAATAAYYAEYLTAAPGEAPGRWSGEQARLLGLSGTVDVDSLQALLEGGDPVTGRQLGHRLLDRIDSKGGVIRAVSGFDATFSAPKSLSVLWALTQDPRLLDAHDTAVDATLRFLERYGSTTRIRCDGRRLHPDALGLTMATFRQTTSRADDPQLHTHAVISAKVLTADGRWLALDARFLKRHQRTLGGLYQSVLRNELTHHFGMAWTEFTNAQAEVVGVPEELLTVFSKRTGAIDAALTAKLDEFRGRQGREPTRWERAALTREASADTRSGKSGQGALDLRGRWIDEAAQVGWSPTSVVAAVETAGLERPAAPVPTLTVSGVIEALSTSGSTWTRADVLRSVCDAQRPVPHLDGNQWAVALERLCDQVIEHCVQLDPADAAARRRSSDGRSMWLEPTAPHLTSEHVLAEEERVLTWAIDAHISDPKPSTTVDCGDLDVLQANAAAAVAGHDRLVLVVGPAGAGKTSALRSAVADLAAQRRAVFGVAPSAKAARVLQRDAGLRSDTVAKVLHEWERRDRSPLRDYLLPAGTTVIVDEAGMIGTGVLARLVALAEQRHWRLALVGDHRQLQAVGRGGLFHELCATGRSHELQRIHRFDQKWEAAASLQLRNGDARALKVYEDHDRIVADTFERHLHRIAEMWLDTAANDGSMAITTATNDHVDAINAAVQAARLSGGQLDESTSVAIGGGERARVGDVVATRRNDRQLTTDDGEPVRNRELWTVTAVHADGSLTVRRTAGRGTVALPAGYVAEHVRLGYAATEHGNQSDTVTIGIQLVTAATTRRGLYVGATRGRAQNLMLVVTKDPDVDEARDVLERVLASDPVDIPATTQRRNLAADDRAPRRERAIDHPRENEPARAAVQHRTEIDIGF
jgi:conjugative relaxase-like TrwC/TraI family protein